MAIIKSEDSVQEEKQKQESTVTEWDRARGIIAKGLKLAAAILEGLAYIGLLLVEYENPSVINCGAEDLQRALEEFPLLARPGDIVSSTGDHMLSTELIMPVSPQTFLNPLDDMVLGKYPKLQLINGLTL